MSTASRLAYTEFGRIVVSRVAMDSAAAFYVERAGELVATELTRGPWDRRFQHGGPVAALLVRAMEHEIRGEPARLARVVVELARPAPIAACTVAARVLHAGRRVATLSAEMHQEGRLVARANALFVREREIAHPRAAEIATLEPGPDASPPLVLPFFVEPEGYHTAMELRLAQGPFGAGKLACWMRMRVPLVAGEPISPSARVLVAADSGNGVSMFLDPTAWTFMNADLVVSLQRLPRGEWVGMRAVTLIEEGGVGLADTGLFDASGQIGRATQSLVVDAR
jgi:hypothetical protein